MIALVALVSCYPKSWVGADPVYVEDPDFPFEVGPYLIRTGPSEASVVIKHELTSPPEVSWWVPTETTTTATAAVRRLGRQEAQQVDGLWVARLRALPPDVELAYRVDSSAGKVGPLKFRAGRSRGEAFRFAAFGDTRTGHMVHRALIQEMARDDIDFLIHSGDIVESGGYEDQWDLFFRIEAPVVSRRFIFAAVGNHDESQRGHFRRYFLNALWSDGRRYYYHDWGDLRVVVVDSEIEARPGSRQHEFLERVLSEGAAENRLMVVVLHYPPYSSGLHGSNLEAREYMHALAVRFGVEAVLSGHDHNYERTRPIDGVTYLVAASGGATIRSIEPSWFSEVLRTEPHYLLFDVERGGLVGRAINIQGNTFDSFVVGPNPPRALP